MWKRRNCVEHHASTDRPNVVAGIRYLAAAVTIFCIAAPHPMALRAATAVNLVQRMEGGSNECVAVDGNVAYTNFGYYLVVLNVSDPTNPQKITNLRLTDPIQDILFDNDLLFIAVGESGLRVIDVLDPSNPFEAGATTEVDARRLALDNGYVYVVEPDDSLGIVDVADPTTPVQVGSVSVPTGYVSDVAAANGYAYVSSTGFYTIDVSDPSNPTQIASLPIASARIALFDSLAYLPSDSLRAVLISDPFNPVDLGAVSPRTGQDIDIDGDRLYLSGQYSFGPLIVLDLADPLAPTLLGTAYLGGRDKSVVASGNLAFVTTEIYGLELFDVSDPSNASFVGSYETFYFPSETARYGNHLYVLGEQGWAIYDLADPASPDHLVSIPIPGASNAIARAGNYAYLPVRWDCCMYYSYVYTYDLSDPSFPVLVDWDQPSSSSSMIDASVSGNLLYVVDNDGIHIYDITNRADPTLITSIFEPWYQISSQGAYLYVAAGYNGLKIYDVSNPAAPVETGSLPFGQIYDVAVVGDYAYVACDCVGSLRIVDVSDPTNPVEVGQHLTPLGLLRRVTVSGIYVYLTDEHQEVHILDASNKASPVEVARFDAGGTWGHVAISGAYVYAQSSEDRGVYVGELTLVTAADDRTANRFELHQNFPNPFNPITTITFELPKTTQVTLDVFDVHGRLVASLVNNILSSGVHLVPWSGRSSSGREVASGVYFYRLRAGGFSEARRMVVLR